ncbi:MAG: hypothetical protein ACTSO9_09120 [Candidatus Helarchaeota archaeon]
MIAQPYYQLWLLQNPDYHHRYKIYVEQKPYNSYFPKWLQNEMKQIYTNIKSAAWNLRSVHERLIEEGYKVVLIYELQYVKF